LLDDILARPIDLLVHLLKLHPAVGGLQSLKKGDPLTRLMFYNYLTFVAR